jgi:hypothetical protein
MHDGRMESYPLSRETVRLSCDCKESRSQSLVGILSGIGAIGESRLKGRLDDGSLSWKFPERKID